MLPLRRAPLRVTVALKIFGIVVGLLGLMCVVAVLTTRLARDVGRQLDFVVVDYIPGYDSIARAHLRSVQQGLYLRRLMILSVETAEDRPALERTLALFQEKEREMDAAIAEARRELAELLQRSGRFTDEVAVARVDTRLDLMRQDHQRYEEAVQTALAALARKDHPEFRRLLPGVDAARDDLDRKLEAARAQMLAITEAAATETRRHQGEVILVSQVVTGIAGGLGLLLAGATTLGLVRPVRRLVAGAKAVQGGALDTVIPITSKDEIGTLTEAFNHMVGELRVKEQIRETFGKYIDPRIVEGLIDRPALTAPGGERRMMTVLFCDMKGFTSISEGLTPRGLVKVLNAYLTTMSAPIREHNGIIDKYIGDAVMAYWGPPFTSDADQAAFACLSALDQLARLALFRKELPELMGLKRGVPDVDARVGIATGEVVVGTIGSDVMQSYTVIGDTVNLASRLEGASKTYGTRILVTETTAGMAATAVETREIDALLVVGKSEPQRVFEVLGRKGELDASTLALRERFATGLAAYRRQAWSEAETEFQGCLAGAPQDGPARVLLERIRHLAEHPPGPGWNGVWSLTEK